jgi:uncharacterized protein (TIGR02453 family)
MSVKVPKSVFSFFKKLEKNNNRDWFNANKPEFKSVEAEVKQVYQKLLERLEVHDNIDKLKLFRIYRDVRFSKDKTPYKINFSSSLSRAGAKLRGGYYIHVQPNNGSILAAGFWGPEKKDLLRIRKELEVDASEFRQIIGSKKLKSIWGDLVGQELKTSPKGFDKEHPNIDLIKKKQFIFTRTFTDKEVLDSGFINEVNKSFKAIRPYFDLMSDILTTDLNGESLLN